LAEHGVPLDGYKYDYLPIVLTKKYTSRWIVDFLLSLRAKDTEVDENDMEESYSDEEDPDGPYHGEMVRGGVRLTKRAWEWVGRH
jgi:hypothetical protein